MAFSALFELLFHRVRSGALDNLGASAFSRCSISLALIEMVANRVVSAPAGMEPRVHTNTLNSYPLSVVSTLPASVSAINHVPGASP